ncbi:MAG: excinuclease ABC subunit UvrC [Polyangiaceae bacterium]|nr:excinuclease ABC subunit UvrC [Polyangiaceae bacterium]
MDDQAAEQESTAESASERWPTLVQEKLDALPARPGCYVFRDKKGKPLYVGKAKSLRSRVRSYFQEGSSDVRAFIPLLLKSVADLETFVTSTEKEAAILENSLIKERQPRFNVKLRDDKEYLTLRLDLRGENQGGQRWPRLELVRRPNDDGARYFGPFHSATAARRTLHLVEKHFQLRTCSDSELASRKRPCLQYQIKRCPAPCVYAIDEDHYSQQVRSVALFLEDRHDELSEELESRMYDASHAMQFELAATYRDQLRAVSVVRQQQRVVVVTDRDQDVMGLYREGDLVELAVLYIRKGRVVEAATFSYPRLELPDDELVAAFLRDHYAEDGPANAWIPDEVLVPVLPDAAEGVAEWLSERRAVVLEAQGQRARRCQVLAPARGPRRQLLELAMDNARHAFTEKKRAGEDMDERLGRIQQRLRLPALPRRIECCDISHLGGRDTVGSIVALKDGKPDKARYRSFQVRLASEGDDYGAMYEVLSRRFLRGKKAAEQEAKDEAATDTLGSREAEWDLPDLFVVDGGKGQLGVALTAAQDLGLFNLPIVGLAKERERPGEEKVVDRVYLPGQKNPVALKPNSPELYMLAHARDEAHRFANRGRKQLGKKRRLGSQLDDVPGVGPVLRKALLAAFGSVARIRRASDEQVLAVRGVGKKQLAALRDVLGREEEPAQTEVEVGEADRALDPGLEPANSVDAADN